MLRPFCPTASALAGSLTVAATALASGTIAPIPVLAPASTTAGWAVSADGSAAAGFAGGPGLFNNAYRWTAAGGSQNLGLLPGESASVAFGMSGNGSIVVGNSSHTGPTGATRAFIWTAATGMQALGALPGHSYSEARAITPDGSVIAGISGGAFGTGLRAFRWEGGVFQDLGTIRADVGSAAYAVSRDGSTVVGASGGRAFRWTSATGMVNIGASLEVNEASLAYAVSGDGSVITGSPLFRWTPATGMVILGALPGGNIATGFGITADGSVIVGNSNGPQGQRAILWSAATGLVDLNTYLPTLGVNLTGWNLTYARAISPSGTAIAGEGTFNGQFVGWVVSGLPSTCRADFNASGVVSVQDIFDFLAAYFAGDFSADFNHSMSLGVQDIFDFLAAYFAGCA